MKDKPFTVEFKHIRCDLPDADEIDLALLREAMAHAYEAGQIKMYRRKGCYYTPKVKAAVMCKVTDNATGKRFYGFSFCSVSENFVTKRGRSIARGRAFKLLGEAMIADLDAIPAEASQ